VKFGTSENKKFLEEVQSNAVRAVFCKSGAACSKTDGFVRVVKVDHARKFPCKAAAEDQDPKLKAALATLAAKRRDEVARYSGLVACANSSEVDKRGIAGGICFKYMAVERSDQNALCNAAYISTFGGKVFSREEAQVINKLKRTSWILDPDKALQGLRNTVLRDGDATLKSLKCTSKGTPDGCCLKSVCQKILTFKNNQEEKFGAETGCPNNSEESAAIKTWLASYWYALGVNIVPTLTELEKGPFPCGDPMSLALRKTTGICYDITRTKINSGSVATQVSQPQSRESVTSRCWKVRNAVKTSEEVVCPSGLLDEGAETRPNKGST
jgi:hypothetical protein